MNIQYCADGYDISGSHTAELDADEVRVWDDDFCVIAVSRTPNGKWIYAASDFVVETKDAEYESWQEALRAHDIDLTSTN